MIIRLDRSRSDTTHATAGIPDVLGAISAHRSGLCVTWREGIGPGQESAVKYAQQKIGYVASAECTRRVSTVDGRDSAASRHRAGRRNGC